MFFPYVILNLPKNLKYDKKVVIRSQIMHMADALLSPAVAGTMYACSGIAASYSIKKVRLENDSKKIPVMGVMGAFVFAAQMINFTIPGTGSSGHLCGGMLLSAILGPEAGFLTMIGVLLIQCLLFADGGILALGGNIWNMAFYGCFIGAMFVWKYTMRQGMSEKKIITASILGSVLTLQLGAFSVTLQTLASGITQLPFGIFVSVMQPIHLAIGLVEGVITSAVLLFVYKARPELLWGYNKVTGIEPSVRIDHCVKINHPVDEIESDDKKLYEKGRLSYRKTIAVLGLSALLIGGLLSLGASSYPDGLEWSMKQVAGDTELESEGRIYQIVEAIQEKTALLPDYSLKNSESSFGTTCSGIVGGVVVVAFCMGGCYLLKFFQHKKEKE